MSDILLSAALIVRNEERFLEACLISLLSRVDEVVIVDTGSTDRTKEIAYAFGARVFDFDWQNDFAQARNFSIDQARGEWILYIDADERLVEFGRTEVESQLKAANCLCYTVQFRPATGFTRYREYRIFRKHPQLRFRGSMHESLLPALDELCVDGRYHIGHSNVALDHLGYDGDLQHKHERNLPLLQARLTSDPWHIYSWDHLGQTLLGLGNPIEAEVAWRQGIEIVRMRKTDSAVDSLLFLHLASLLLDQGRNASDLLEEGCRLFPENHSLTWLHARQLANSGRYAEAKPLFGSLAEIDPTKVIAGRLAFDTSIFGAQAYAGMGFCAFQLGNYGESAELYARAATLAPNDLEIRSKQAFAAMRARTQGQH